MVYRPGLVKRFGMIAGGTGITPMLQIVKAIIRGREAGDTTEVDLLFANVNPEDILLKEDLDALAAKDSKFRVHYVLNNPPEKWDGGVGFVTADMIKVCIPPWECWQCLTQSIGQASTPKQRHEDSHLRSSAYDQRNEEGHRVSRIRQGAASQQA
jgi:NAD(P)H-flavin reductase